MSGATAEGSTALQIQGIERRKRMPLSHYFKGHGKKVMANMKAKNGEKAGEREFYATAQARGMTPSGTSGTPSDTPKAAEEKIGAKMAAGMPKRKTFGQRLAQREG